MNRSLKLLLFMLYLVAPATSQDWNNFERLLYLKKFRQAQRSLETWPPGQERDIASIESLLALQRPDLAWQVVTGTSVRAIPQHLRARFFLSRGRLQMLQAEFKLAEKDFTQVMREQPSPTIRAQALERRVALYLTLGDSDKVKDAMNDFVEVPDQTEFALLAAYQRSLEEGRSQEAVAILRLFKEHAEVQGMKSRADHFRLLEVQALWQTGYPHKAFDLAQEIEKNSADDYHRFYSLLHLEEMSREMKEHRDQTLTVVQDRVDAFSLPEYKTRLLLTVWGQEAAQGALREAREAESPRLLVLALLKAARRARFSGHFEDSTSYLTEAMQLLEKHPSSYRGSGYLNDATVAEVLSAQSALSKRQGDLATSIALLEQAIEMAPGPYHAKWRAYAYRDMLQGLLESSDYHGARTAFFAGLKEIENAPLGDNKAYMLNVLFNSFFGTHRVWDLEQLSLGMVGQFDPLGRLIMKELAQRPSELEWTLAAYRDWVAEVRIRGNRPKLSEALAFQGQYLTAIGRYSEAESALSQAYDIATKESLIDMRQWSQMNLARTAYDQGQLKKATSHMQTSVDILAEHDTYYSSYSLGLATLLAKLGRHQEALRLYDDFPGSGSCLLAAADLAGQTGQWELALKKSEQAIEFFTQKRLSQMLFQAKLQRARALAHLNQLSDSEALFEELFKQGDYGQQFGVLRAWIESREFTQRDHAKLARLLSKSLKVLDQRLPRELISMEQQHDSESFLEELHRMRSRDRELDRSMLLKESELPTIQSRLSPDQLFLHLLAAGDRMVALLITGRSMRVVEIQVDKSHQNKMLTGLSESLVQPRNSRTKLDRLNKEFSNLLLPALEPEMSKTKQLEVLLAGELRTLPLEILLEKSGLALLHRVEVSYVDSTRPGLAKPAPLAGEKLLLGGSDLRGASQELENVSALLGDYVQADNLTKLKEASATSSLIHVATHSEIQEDALGSGHFLLGSEKVTFEDIYSLKLPPGSMVVLSSCRSASGGKGRELVSLSSAFLYGGASTTIGSLWRVDDRTTAVFFQHFYEALSKGSTPGQALRHAKLRLKENPETEHPYFWAPFVLYGRAG